MFIEYKNLSMCIFRGNKLMRRVQGRLCIRSNCRWGQFELQSLTLGARLSDPPLHQTLFTKLLIFLGLALTRGWLDFHPPILGQMVGNPTNPRWNIHPMDGFLSSGWNSIHTGWISNRMDGNPTIRPSWPRCSCGP